MLFENYFNRKHLITKIS